jgi:hypothetical protein
LFAIVPQTTPPHLQHWRDRTSDFSYKFAVSRPRRVFAVSVGAGTTEPPSEPVARSLSNLKCKLRRIFGVSRRATRACEMAAKLKRNLIPSSPCLRSVPSFSLAYSLFPSPGSPSRSFPSSSSIRELFIRTRLDPSLRSRRERKRERERERGRGRGSVSFFSPSLSCISRFWNADYRSRDAKKPPLSPFERLLAPEERREIRTRA